MIKKLLIIISCIALSQNACSSTQYSLIQTEQQLPNFILIMTDDQGYGDVGYYGHPKLKTPHLDQMVKDGLRFDRFYAGSAVCSPTRGSCLTGRHPFRYGIPHANTGHMKIEEITLAEVLKQKGYRTGHFGKWHLGTLTTTMKDANRAKPGKTKHFSPPQLNGFDTCFTTESKVPTWDPMKIPKKPSSKKLGWKHLKEDDKFKHYGTHYFNEKGEIVTDNLEGDDSRVIMDRAVDFVKANAKKPFFMVIWFHAPHLPVVAGPKYAAMYKDENLYTKNYYGCITALDEQIGRLRKTLKEQGCSDNTLITFCSDNGPEGNDEAPGSANDLRGRKRSLYEGGIRVPGIMVWPKKIAKGRVTDIPCVTSDYFTTIIDIIGMKIPENPSRPYDGVSLLSLIEEKMSSRPKAIGFEIRNQVALSDNRYKLYSKNSGKTYELYDLVKDRSEKNDISAEKPELVKAMAEKLELWRKSCKDSAEGKDY